MYDNLTRLGFDEWMQNACPEYITNGFSPARIIEVNKNRYIASDGKHEMPAELSGKFLFDAENAADFPTVGDWVAIQDLDNHALAIVHAILPRKTLLKRKEPGKRIAFQLIASNIDFGLVMQSADHLNLNLLDRYFVMLHESNIQPIAVFNKIDLLSSAEAAELRDKVSRLKHEYRLISTIADHGIDTLLNELIPNKTYCLLGQSGVGKTSLLNRLVGAHALRVSTVREKDGRGRHTTVRRQLIRLESGSIFIDTPGMRELGNFDIDDGLEQAFEDFSSYAAQCRFRDCTHKHEDGCAIIEAVREGKIEESRYANFLKLRKESDFYGLSYREKRKKDKSFGKMVKNFKKRAEKM